jgi:hypothetical protein
MYENIILYIYIKNVFFINLFLKPILHLTLIILTYHINKIQT